MNPTPEEIRSTLASNDDVQIVPLETTDQPGFIETLVVTIRNYAVRIFRRSTVQRVIFAVVMPLAAFDGVEFAMPRPIEIPSFVVEIQNTSHWIANISARTTPENKSKYLVLGAFGKPTPADDKYTGPESTIFAPISGSNIISESSHSFRPYQTGSYVFKV